MHRLYAIKSWPIQVHFLSHELYKVIKARLLSIQIIGIASSAEVLGDVTIREPMAERYVAKAPQESG